MTQIWVEQQAMLPGDFDAVFDALLCALPRLGLRLRSTRRRQGTVTALMPPWQAADQLSISLFRIDAGQTCLTLQCAAPRPPDAAAVSLKNQSVRQILAEVQLQLGQSLNSPVGAAG